MGLINPRKMKEALAAPQAIPAGQLEAARLWAASVRDQSIHRQTESQIEGRFQHSILETVLGYKPFGQAGAQTYKPKQAMGRGIADIALGNFSGEFPKIIAPLELKGADTRDLDAPMAGRNKTPVQQAWEYANAVAGAKWVLVSNMLEIRLYAFGEGQQDYERIDLARLEEPEEFARAQLLLSAESLLGTRLSDLLRESKLADKELSNALYADYHALRVKLVDAVNEATAGADKVQAVNTAQKILDRVLFVAFAEDRDLLPPKSLEKAFNTQNDYDPHPVWKNFKGLFRAIDEGSEKLKISKYNGGLFKFDDAVDTLNLSDAICEEFKKIGDYRFDTEVSITVLGHIFEQSVSDVEKLLAIARGEETGKDEKTSGVKGRRKRDGIVYTPDYIAQFIVEKTLGVHVEELFRNTMAKHAKGDPADYGSLRFGPKAGTGEALKNELQAWYVYRLALKTLRLVDPACGSGVFLVTAFDYLKAEYERVAKKIAQLRNKGDQTDIEDIDREILSQNLYGVDVNAESVEITKLSLWLKTARKGKELDSLDHNIRVGDSLIEDSSFAYLKHGFSWNAAFPEVFAAGGFDVVLGNPPYVRMELIKPMKPYLEKRFEVVSDRADLYCYFFERGVRLLKPDGRLGYISSSTFFKTGSGAPLRRYILRNASIETVADFGDLQIFEGVTTYPVILTMRRHKAEAEHAIRFWKLDKLPEGNFNAAYEVGAEPFKQVNLSEGSWELENPALRKLREKIVAGRKTLKEVYGSPLYGIKTGLNEAFIVNSSIRDSLIAEDPRSAELLKPLLMGINLDRWGENPVALWIIYTPKNVVDIAGFPAIARYMEKFRLKLEKRATKQHWFELQQAQLADSVHMTGSKIVYNRFLSTPKFFLDTSGRFINDAPYFLPTSDWSLLALLNSHMFWYSVSTKATLLSGGYYQLHGQYVEQFPLPEIPKTERKNLSSCAVECQSLFQACTEISTAFRRRIPDLCPPDRDPKLTTKLQEWWNLPDFTAFRAEVKKCFKAEIPVNERTEWEDLFTSGKTEIARLSAGIKRNEDEINAIVYKLFDLTAEEIELLETSIGAK